jgi:hypothetical protein
MTFTPCQIKNSTQQFNNSHVTYRDDDKTSARPTSRCILFDGENISFEASLVIYIHIHIHSTNIPAIMIINRIYENQNLLSL